MFNKTNKDISNRKPTNKHLILSLIMIVILISSIVFASVMNKRYEDVVNKLDVEYENLNQLVSNNDELKKKLDELKKLDESYKTSEEYETIIDEYKEQLAKNQDLIDQYKDGEVVNKDHTNYVVTIAEEKLQVINTQLSQTNNLVHVSEYKAKVGIQGYDNNLSLYSSFFDQDVMYLALYDYVIQHFIVGYIDMNSPEIGGFNVMYSDYKEDEGGYSFAKDEDELLLSVGNKCLVFDIKDKEYKYSEVFENKTRITYTDNRDFMFTTNRDYVYALEHDGESYDLYTGYFAGKEFSKGLGYAIEGIADMQVSPSGDYLSYVIYGYESGVGPIYTDLYGNRIYQWPDPKGIYSYSGWIDSSKYVGTVYNNQDVEYVMLDLQKKEVISFAVDNNASLIVQGNGLFVIENSDWNMQKTIDKVFDSTNLKSYIELDFNKFIQPSFKYFDKDNLYTVSVNEGEMVINHYSYDFNDYISNDTRTKPAAINKEYTFIYEAYDGIYYGKAHQKILDLYKVNEDGSAFEYIGSHDFNKEARNYTAGLYQWEPFKTLGLNQENNTSEISYTEKDGLLIISADRGKVSYNMDLDKYELITSSYFYGLLRLQLLEWIDEDNFRLITVNRFIEDSTIKNKVQ